MAQENKLAAKLVKILNNLGSVEKKGYNSHQKYHYMREVDVMEALKTQLIENKMIMLTSSEFVDIQRKEGDKKVDFITTVKTTHTFIDSETGEQLSINSVGSGYDSSDKGASKAITAAFKYAVVKTFMISDEGADIENDGKTVQPPAVTTPTIKPAVIKAEETKPAAPAAKVPTKLPTATVKATAPVAARVSEPATTVPQNVTPTLPKRKVPTVAATIQSKEPNFP